jgi:arylsulfatase
MHFAPSIQKPLLAALTLCTFVFAGGVAPITAQNSKPNIVMLMTDDTGWNDFGAYSGGGAFLGHPTPNIDKMSKEGAVFTSWYGQASCTAGRASFMTGRIPIRSALSIVVAPGDENFLRKETPTIAEFFKKNGYTTYFSGKRHMGDKPIAYPTEHGFDEMKSSLPITQASTPIPIPPNGSIPGSRPITQSSRRCMTR